MEDHSRSPRVLVSYSHGDRTLANRIVRWMVGFGIEYFIDQHISAGEDLAPTIRDKMDGCTHVLVILSADAAVSQWVQFELGMAYYAGKHIIAYKTSAGVAVPPYISQLKHIDSPADLRLELKRIKAQAPCQVDMPSVTGLAGVPGVAAKLYRYPDGAADAVRLYGADGETVTAERLRVSYTHSPLVVDPALRGQRDRHIEVKRLEAEKYNRLFFDGPNTRLLSWRGNPSNTADRVTEDTTLTLSLGPVGWFDYEGLNDVFSRHTHDANFVAHYGEFIGLEPLLQSGDVSACRLSNILDTVTTLVTRDGWAALQVRGARQSVAPGRHGASVAENINRYLDDTDPTDSAIRLNLQHLSDEARRQLSNDYRPSGVPHPIATVRRGISEELSPALTPYLSPRAIRLTGLAFDLEVLHPDALFMACIDLDRKAVELACRETPGKDWYEGHLQFVRADFTDRGTHSALAEHDWLPAGKASLIRAIEVLNAWQRDYHCDFPRAFEKLRAAR